MKTLLYDYSLNHLLRSHTIRGRETDNLNHFIAKMDLTDIETYLIYPTPHVRAHIIANSSVGMLPLSTSVYMHELIVAMHFSNIIAKRDTKYYFSKVMIVTHVDSTIWYALLGICAVYNADIIEWVRLIHQSKRRAQVTAVRVWTMWRPFFSGGSIPWSVID